MQLLADAIGNYLAGGPFASQASVSVEFASFVQHKVAAENFLVGAFRFGAHVLIGSHPRSLSHVSNKTTLSRIYLGVCC